jgi:hypothetical protein
VLRYDALDRREPFRDVKLKRDDLLRLWSPVVLNLAAPESEPERLIEPASWPTTCRSPTRAAT